MPSGRLSILVLEIGLVRHHMLPLILRIKNQIFELCLLQVVGRDLRLGWLLRETRLIEEPS